MDPDVFCEKGDNLLVEADILYHFWGIVLCNTRRLQFHCKKNLGAQFIKSPIPICFPLPE